jgi:hypothetical protein
MVSASFAWKKLAFFSKGVHAKAQDVFGLCALCGMVSASFAWKKLVIFSKGGSRKGSGRFWALRSLRHDLRELCVEKAGDFLKRGFTQRRRGVFS